MHLVTPTAPTDPTDPTDPTAPTKHLVWLQEADAFAIPRSPIPMWESHGVGSQQSLRVRIRLCVHVHVCECVC